MKPKRSQLQSIYDKAIRDNNIVDSDSLSELVSFLKIDVMKQKSSSITENENNSSANPKETQEFDLVYPTINHLSYFPKRNIKFTPKNLVSYLDPNLKKIKIGDTVTDAIKSKPQGNSDTALECNFLEMDFLKFKTAFILKFAKNADYFDKLTKYFDNFPETNRKFLLESYRKLRNLSEEKDRILFDTMGGGGSKDIQAWKHITMVFYESEIGWQKLCELIFKELKDLKDLNMSLNKKCSEKDNILKLQERELSSLSRVISENELNPKKLLKNKKVKDAQELREEFKQRENFHLININRLEDEIRDLTSLLDKEKEYFNNYNDSLKKIDEKKKEIEEMRVKHNLKSEENEQKLAYLNNERQELTKTVKTLEKEQIELKAFYDNSKKEYIEHQTQVKILRQTLNEKNENINMLTEEMDTWMTELYKEKVNHFNTSQTLAAVEIKLQKEKEKNQRAIGINAL